MHPVTPVTLLMRMQIQLRVKHTTGFEGYHETCWQIHFFFKRIADQPRNTLDLWLSTNGLISRKQSYLWAASWGNRSPGPWFANASSRSRYGLGWWCDSILDVTLVPKKNIPLRFIAFVCTLALTTSSLSLLRSSGVKGVKYSSLCGSSISDAIVLKSLHSTRLLGRRIGQHPGRPSSPHENDLSSRHPSQHHLPAQFSTLLGKKLGANTLRW